MERVAFKMKLHKGKKEEYQKRHQQIWPAIKDQLKEAGISDYAIYFDEETDSLFAVQKLSGKTDSQKLGNSDIMKKWWAYMADIMVTNFDNSPVSTNLEEVFYME